MFWWKLILAYLALQGVLLWFLVRAGRTHF